MSLKNNNVTKSEIATIILKTANLNKSIKITSSSNQLQKGTLIISK